MVKVPEYIPNVSLRPASQSQFTIRANAEHFGAAVGRGMQQAARGLEQLSQSLQAVQNLEDEARVRERRNEYMRERDALMYDPQTGYMFSQGKNALDQRASFAENMRKLREKYANGLTPRQQTLFSRSIDTLELDAQRSAMIHNGNELKNFVVQEGQAAAANFANEAMRHIGNQEMYDKYIAASLNELRQVGAMQGLSAEQMELREREFLSTATRETALMMAANDPLAAEEFIKKHADRLTPKDKLATEEKIAGAVLNAKIERETARVLGVVPPEVEPAERSDDGLTQSEVERSALPPVKGADDPATESVQRAFDADAAVPQLSSTDFAARIMAKYVGMHERSDNRAISEFIRNSTGFNINPAVTPWCAAFVNAALGAAGIEGTGSLAARSFLNFGKEVTEPQVGDIVVLSRGSNPAHGHVGFFQGYDENGRVLVLGGNQGDRVSVAPFAANRVLGFRRAGYVDEKTARLPNYSPQGLAQIYDQVAKIEDPKVRAGVMKSVQEQLTARKKLIDAQREEAQSFVEQQILADPTFDPTRLPIEVQSALGASGMTTAMEFKRKVTEWGQPETDDGIWASLQDQFADNPESFADMDIWQYRSSLSNDDFKTLQAWRNTARTDRRKAQETGAIYKRAYEVAEEVYDLAGIVTGTSRAARSDRAKIRKLNDAMRVEVDQFIQREGRAPGYADLRTMAVILAGEARTEEGGLFGARWSGRMYDRLEAPGGTTLKFKAKFEDIPAEWVNVIVETLTVEKGGEPPTRAEIEERWSEIAMEIVGAY